MKASARLILMALALLADGRAEALTFDFKESKGVNNVVFELDAPLESIKGTAKGISGSVTVDPANLADAKGRIVVATNSLIVPNPLMRAHLLSKDWLGARSNPEISFDLRKVGDVESKGANVSEAKVTGVLSLNGISKEITAVAKVTFMPGRLREFSKGKLEGDLLVIRSEFGIKRSDFGIRPGEFLDKVSNEIDLSLSLAGAAAKGR